MSVDFLVTNVIGAGAAGDVALIKKYLKRGDNPNMAHRSCGTTALMYAARHGHSDAVRVLLEAGANPSQVDRWGQTALHLAAMYDLDFCVVQLLGKTDRTLRDSNGMTAEEVAGPKSLLWFREHKPPVDLKVWLRPEPK